MTPLPSHPVRAAAGLRLMLAAALVMLMGIVSLPVAYQQGEATSTVTPLPSQSYVLGSDIYVRGGPGEYYQPVGALRGGAILRPISRNADTTWILIAYYHGVGWIRRDLAVWRENLDELPVVDEAALTITPIPGSETPIPIIPTATPIGNWVDAGNVGAFLRTGPGFSFALYGEIEDGTTVEPVGRNEDTSWILIRRSAGFAWINRLLVHWVVDLSALPVLHLGALTPSATFTFTQTPIPSGTPTITLTQTASATVTATATATATASVTPSVTATPSSTVTNTPTATLTASATSTVTASTTPTATPTPTPTTTPSVTASQTSTDTATFTLTASATASITASNTATWTATPTATLTETAQPASETPTETVTATATSSSTATITPTATLTASPAATALATDTAVSTFTPTATPTAVLTATETPITPTATITQTETLVPPTLTTTSTPEPLVAQAVPTDTPSASLDSFAQTSTAVGIEVMRRLTATANASSPVPTATAISGLNQTATMIFGELSRITTLTAEAATAIVDATPSPVSETPLIPSDTPINATEIAFVVPPVNTPAPLPSETAPRGGLPTELWVGGGALLLALGYIGMYWRGAVGAERYADGFVIDRCPACGRGNLHVDTTVTRTLGIPRARYTVRCTACRSVLREAGTRRWRYAVDRSANPVLYDRYNNRVLDESQLPAVSQQAGVRQAPHVRTPSIPPDFVSDDALDTANEDDNDG
ncbi:MAG: hypothetical protein U0670_12485 [Anaerolineae bacterium]